MPLSRERYAKAPGAPIGPKIEGPWLWVTVGEHGFREPWYGGKTRVDSTQN